MYTTQHYIYLSIALPIVILASFFASKANQKVRLNIIRASAIAMLLFHLSPVVINLFVQDNYMPVLYSTIIWPTYFCNVSLWVLVITFCGPKVLKKIYPIAINFAFWGGFLTLLVPGFHAHSIFEWNTFRSYMSHTLMLFIALSVFVSGDYKPKVKDIIKVTMGLLAFIAYGAFTNFLFITYKNYSPNSMYLTGPMFEGTILYGYFVIPMFFLTMLTTFILYETFTLKKQDRTLNKLFKKIKKK